MIELQKEDRHYLRPLCKERNSIDLWAALEGNMGNVWSNSKENPQYGIVLAADFCYLLGDVEKDYDELIVKDYLDKCKGKIIVPDNDTWINLLKKYYPDSFKAFNRYSTKRDIKVFDRNILKEYIINTESYYKIQRIDDALYYKVLEDSLMSDCCSNFSSLKEFKENGIGYVILHQNEIISAASSYSYSKGFIDITIATKDQYRRRGLGLACASKVILECLDNNIYPVWDAVDMRSIALAEKIGYDFDKEYVVYTIR